jgi:hypothetical protein
VEVRLLRDQGHAPLQLSDPAGPADRNIVSETLLLGHTFTSVEGDLP